MKPVLGISVYPDMDSMDEIRDYIRLASSYGFTRVFSSMFSVEGDDQEVLALFKELASVAHTYHMELSLDVNPQCFKRFGASQSDLSVFHEIGCDIVRMDMSFGKEGDIELLKNPFGIKVEFNASFKTKDDIEEMLQSGVGKERLLFCHNFYPQPYTGMKWQKFLDVNEKLHSSGVRVGAFISSHAKGSHGVWDANYGLPTVEKLRRLPVDLQVRILLASKNVTDILFGNAFASEEEFQSIQNVLTKKEVDKENPVLKMMESFGAKMPCPEDAIKIKVKLDADITDVEKKVLLDYFPHSDIGDSSEWIWRSRMPRMIYQNEEIPQRKCEKQFFEKGDVLIMNDVYEHYKAEIQICLLPMENDGQRNYLGHIEEQEQMILDQIQDRDTVIFLESE